jgi:DNA transposition AAA+ family ATPase
MTEMVLTKPVKHLEKFAQLAWHDRCIAVFSGREGIGKTRGFQRIAASNAFPKIAFRSRPTISNSGLLEELRIRLSIERSSGSRYLNNDKLYREVGLWLVNHPALVVIDEADGLHQSCFELVRAFHDEYGVPFLLIGNEQLETKIDREHPRLARRIYRYKERDLSREQTRDVADAMGFKLSDEEFDMLWKYCGGSPGWVEMFVRQAEFVATANGTNRGPEAILAAFAEIPKPRRSATRVAA